MGPPLDRLHETARPMGGPLGSATAALELSLKAFPVPVQGVDATENQAEPLAMFQTFSRIVDSLASPIEIRRSLRVILDDKAAAEDSGAPLAPIE